MKKIIKRLDKTLNSIKLQKYSKREGNYVYGYLMWCELENLEKILKDLKEINN